MFKSWKTTLAGFLTFIGATYMEINTLLDDDPLTNPTWSVVLFAFLAFLGLSQARDNDVTSESAGANNDSPS